jgi:formiminotetrahydrofolate cyclodeaminase
MSFIQKSCTEFVDVLASKASCSSGGGASAFVGASEMALGNMVGNLDRRQEEICRRLRPISLRS